MFDLAQIIELLMGHVTSVLVVWDEQPQVPSIDINDIDDGNRERCRGVSR